MYCCCFQFCVRNIPSLEELLRILNKEYFCHRHSGLRSKEMALTRSSSRNFEWFSCDIENTFNHHQDLRLTTLLQESNLIIHLFFYWEPLSVLVSFPYMESLCCFCERKFRNCVSAISHLVESVLKTSSFCRTELSGSIS